MTTEGIDLDELERRLRPGPLGATVAGNVMPDTLLALIARLRAAEDRIDVLRDQVGRLTRDRNDWETNATAAETRVQELEARPNPSPDYLLIVKRLREVETQRDEAVGQCHAAVRAHGQITAALRVGSPGRTPEKALDTMASVRSFLAANPGRARVDGEQTPNTPAKHVVTRHPDSLECSVRRYRLAVRPRQEHALST